MLRAASLAVAAALAAAQPYQPTWPSLNSRPLPTWYDEAKVGIFIHWGVFSVPSWGTASGGASGEWFWWNLDGIKDPAYQAFVTATEAPSFTYPDYGARFDATFFNATQWAQLFKASGARYIVPTSKHHEGWCNWPSASAFNWNSGALGPKRDIIGEIADAVKAEGLVFGVYHSLFEWFNPLYLADKASNFSTRSFVTQKTMPELYDLVNSYQPQLIWSDGDWEAPDTYWGSTDFLAWLVNESPVKDTAVFNDRWGIGDICKNGAYLTCNDRFLPSSKQSKKWENAFTLDRWSWGYRRTMQLSDVLTVDEVVETIVQTVALGGNALINIGPAHDGTIDAIFQDRLLGMGAWLGVNGEAIYGTTPFRIANDTAASVWYTAVPSTGAVYAIVTEWPASNTLTLTVPVPSAGVAASMLGTSASVAVKPLSSAGQPGVLVTLPALPVSQLPCQNAWVVKLAGVN